MQICHPVGTLLKSAHFLTGTDRKWRLESITYNTQNVTSAPNILQPLSSGSLQSNEQLTQFCKATADSLRLQILRLLRNDSLSVLEMTRILDIRQPALSHHLKILAGAGLVTTRREGNLTFYRRSLLNTDAPFYELRRSLFNTIDRMSLETVLKRQLQAVKQERERHSLDFFNKFADKFQQNADLVADSQQYASCFTDLLQEASLSNTNTALEVGSGEGKLLSMLADGYRNIIAVDNDAAMLERAKQSARDNGLDNIEFVLGDTDSAVTEGRKANLVVMSMVLHHIQEPARVFSDLAQLLEANGVALVVDLCRHNQEWLRDMRGDLWLGFEPEELTQWAEAAQLSDGQSLYLGLRNGFQVQMRLFHKKEDKAA